MVLQRIKSNFRDIREEYKFRRDLFDDLIEIRLLIKLGNYKQAKLNAQKLANKL